MLWTVSSLMCLAALVSSLYLLPTRPVFLPVTALVAASLRLAMSVGFIRLGIAGVSLPVVLSVALGGTGLWMLIGSSGKSRIVAATIVTLVGFIQLIRALGIL